MTAAGLQCSRHTQCGSADNVCQVRPQCNWAIHEVKGAFLCVCTNTSMPFNASIHHVVNHTCCMHNYVSRIAVISCMSKVPGQVKCDTCYQRTFSCHSLEPHHDLPTSQMSLIVKSSMCTTVMNGNASRQVTRHMSWTLRVDWRTCIACCCVGGSGGDQRLLQS